MTMKERLKTTHQRNSSSVFCMVKHMKTLFHTTKLCSTSVRTLKTQWLESSKGLLTIKDHCPHYIKITTDLSMLLLNGKMESKLLKFFNYNKK